MLYNAFHKEPSRIPGKTVLSNTLRSDTRISVNDMNFEAVCRIDKLVP
jgi:hypothetical protein